MRPIDADELYKKFIDGESDTEQERSANQLARYLIRHEPTMNAAPVIHAKWVYDKNATDWGIGGYICSQCKNKNNNLPCNRVKSVQMFSGATFCPNCGAKMDLEAADE